MDNLQIQADIIDRLGKMGDELQELHQKQSDLIQSMKDDIEAYVDQLQIGGEDV